MNSTDGVCLLPITAVYTDNGMSQDVSELPASVHSPENNLQRHGPTPDRCSWLLGSESDNAPTLSIILPTLNEQRGIGPCLEQIEQALTEMQVYGEIIVSDSSDDYTPVIARLHGAQVITPSKEGYGAAYQAACSVARGEYIAMGDADTTYDFTELPQLLTLVRDDNADMAIGSRLEGEIKPNAMPTLHEYIGNPVLTGFLNMFYDAGVSDAHSGMRVFSKAAWEEMNCSTTGMEFASEMIMKAGAKDLTIEEEPITYHERKGNASLESIPDGWRHIRFMLLNAPGYLFSIPGMLLLFGGITLMGLCVFDITVGDISFGTHSLVMSALATLVGFQISNFAVFATVAGDPIKRPVDPYTNWLLDRLTLERGIVIGAALLCGGGGYTGVVITRWIASQFSTLPILKNNIVAIVAMVIGVQLLFSAFLFSALVGE